MKTFNRIRKTFVRQSGSHDCGIACLCMILRYAGREPEAILLRETITDHDLSLLDLRYIAAKYGLSGRCVTMDPEFLTSALKPCVLLLTKGNGQHFQVCYGKYTGSGEKRYVMGDPARGIYLLAEINLRQIWNSGAALYLENVPEEPAELTWSSRQFLGVFRMIPKVLLVIIPLLTIFTGILGVAWSWALQRGIYDSIADKKSSLIRAIIILLFVVTLAKNGFSYIRQQLMIRLNCLVNEQFTIDLQRRVLWRGRATGRHCEPENLRAGMSGVTKIQQGISVFLATVLSKGSVIMLLITLLFYQSWVFGLVITLYMLIAVYYSFRTFPRLLFDQAHLNEQYGAIETAILRDDNVTRNRGENADFEKVCHNHARSYQKYLEYAAQVSTCISRDTLIIDCLGTCSVICIFIDGVLQMQRMELSYSGFMFTVVLSYFVTTLVPKVCSALFILSDAIESSDRFRV